MKEFKIPLIVGGYQLHVIIVTKTKKEAAKQLDISIYYLSTYGYPYEPTTELAINNPYQRFAYFDGGWLREFKPNWFRKVMPYQELANYIHEANKVKYDKLLKIKS